MNILILSCGTRNKIVEYFKREIPEDGRIVAADCSVLAPALYEADTYYQVPPIIDREYIDRILEICEKEHIDAVFSLIDPELEILAENKKRFLQNGVIPIVSEKDVIDICFDKYKMFEFCSENQIPTVLTYENLLEFYDGYKEQKIKFPVFVKPRYGSCSIEAQAIDSIEKLKLLCGENHELIIQEYINGMEIGADVYVDLISKETVSVFTKQKLFMRAGETDKAVSIKENALFELIQRFVKKLGVIGHIDIDLFKKGEDYLVSEVNPRFGGGYPHAYECGVNFPAYIINNINGIENEPGIGDYDADIYMMKYLNVKIKSAMEKDK